MKQNYNINIIDIQQQIDIFNDKKKTTNILYNEKTRIFTDKNKECAEHLKSFKLDYSSNSESDESDTGHELKHINLKHINDILLNLI